MDTGTDMRKLYASPCDKDSLTICELAHCDFAGRLIIQTGWCRDHYPFVAVMLLSDPVMGGHTVIKKGDQSEVKVAYAHPGCCIVMQVPIHRNWGRTPVVNAVHRSHLQQYTCRTRHMTDMLPCSLHQSGQALGFTLHLLCKAANQKTSGLDMWSTNAQHANL